MERRNRPNIDTVREILNEEDDRVSEDSSAQEEPEDDSSAGERDESGD